MAALLLRAHHICMPTLTADSSFEDIRAEYATTASYAEQNSVALAKRFVTACRFLILDLPRSTGHGRSNMQLSPDLIREELKEAQRFIESRKGRNPGVKHLSFNRMRD